MTMAIGFEGRPYDPAVPLYVSLGHGFVVNRLTGQILGEQSLQDQMAAEGYTPGVGEVGPDERWLANNSGPWSFWSPEVAPQEEPDEDLEDASS